MSVDVADLVAKLGLDAALFTAGMATAQRDMAAKSLLIKASFAAIGIAAAAAAAAMVKSAADFEQNTQQFANNTNLGAKGLAEMRAGVLELSRETGLPMQQLEEGWMRVANHAYEGAAAMNIARAAARNAAATGGDAADDMNVLAGVMREYGVSAAQAASNTQLATQYIDVLHNAVANSNYTMKEFAEGAKMAFATAGSYGVPLSQVSSQLALLSEHGFPSVQRATLNWDGMLRSLEKPTATALKNMKALSAATGVDLVGDITRLRRDGAFLPQFLADIQKATGGDRVKIGGIMTQQSYANALQALVRFGGELGKIQAMTGAAQAGQMMPGMTGTNEAFTAWTTTTNAKLQVLRGTLNSVAVQFGTVFLPAIKSVLDAVTPLVGKFSDWVSALQALGGPRAMTAVQAQLGQLGTVLVTWMNKTAAQITAATNGWAHAIETWLAGPTNGAPSQMDKYMQALVAWTQSKGPQAMLNLTNALSAALMAGLNAAIVGALKGFGAKFVEGLVGQPEFTAGGAVYKWGLGIAAPIISGLTRGLQDGATVLGTRLGIVFGSLMKAMRDIGVRLAQGLVDGIKSMAGAVKDAVGGLGKSAVDHLKGVLGIHSPSAVMHDLGRQTMEGYVLGLRAGAGGVAGAMSAALGRPGTPGLGAGGGIGMAPLPGALGGGHVVNVTVSPATGGVDVATSGGASERVLGGRIGRAVLRELEAAAQTVTPPAPRMQPGARAS
jgi:TP901 family phage tail tape measure protein